MFKNHPKGLPVLFFTEMWERFGFYTMLAIFVYYLQANFGWDTTTVTSIYGIFLASVYFTPIIGGWIADNFLGYGRTITLGAIIMAIGYAFMAIPSHTPVLLYTGLTFLVVGNGLFKANISVLVGNLYSHKEGSVKDAGFNLFYMGINIGAFYAPQAAAGIKNLMMNHFGLSLAEGYNAGFAVSGLGMLISLIIFTAFKKYYKEADYQSKNEAADSGRDVQLSPKEEKERITALLTIFAIVIFFWMSFHQNGSALSLFARDYTDHLVGRFTNIFFSFFGIHGILAFLLGLGFMFSKSVSKKTKNYGGILALVGAIILVAKYFTEGSVNEISPEQFQYFNPMFIILLTPVIVGYFKFLNKRGKEPSSPGKIGLGMLFTAVAFGLMMLASFGLPAVHTLNGGPSPITVSPYWLISSYFVVTVAELHLSPMGLSFVSKVSPPKIKGLMMGLWFGATAVGNYLSGFVGRFYENWELWQFFALLVTTSLVAAFLLRLTLNRLKKATASSM
jgi:POT family proton-dependent oligopeptide transporter